jgi:hypothetical protein
MTTTQTHPTVGPLVTLATYHCDTGPRQIVGQRVDGAVQLRDEPADRPGRSFVIESGLHSKTEMDAIVADYRKCAQRLGYTPMLSLGW